ncbi:Ankyrin repeat family protein [Hibiscus syriacus]|uniref:Ankyrin repeat family protein n=1 Tax=Hibiscus syriacus TaxID=106335 RepID=A0A6A2X0U0_HIBSY|nr:Ankyrin repeat family protein [Hibiscus syriacus]
MEVANLKPSLAWKLNQMGLSSIHLALQHECIKMVRGLITLNAQLIRVKAKGMVTPLHYVAQIEDPDLLAEFLSACPSSIEDTTVHCETAVHVAIRNCSIRCFRVLVGWLRRVDKDDVLNWKDEEGNTALHIAMVKLLVKNVNVNVKNIDGLTAMDIFHLQGSLQNPEIGKILHKAKAERSSDLNSNMTLGDYFSKELSLIDIRDKYFGTNTRNKHNDIRSVLLVVAVLIATASYQAGLSPPCGYWQDDYIPPENNSTNNANSTGLGQGQRAHRAGQMIMSPAILFYFLTLNGLAFHLSVWTILVIIIGLPFSGTLYTSTSLLMYAYYASMVAAFPTQGSVALTAARALFVALTITSTVAVYLIPWVTFSKHQKLKRLVDTMRGSRHESFPSCLHVNEPFKVIFLGKKTIASDIATCTADPCYKKLTRNRLVSFIVKVLPHRFPVDEHRIDRIPIVDTQLHDAAVAGKPHFAMVVNLKPSLGWKLNYMGLSPIHLALQHQCIKMVRRLITLNAQLIRVKAKGMITPLHYLAQIEDPVLFAEFLSVCPSSIEDTTVHCETAVHVAIRNHSIRCFKVLVGWLRRVNKEDVLNWKDEDGNTALHIAISTSTNQTEASFNICCKTVNVNVNNFNGLTAMDVFHLQGSLQNPEIGKILHKAKAKKASDLTSNMTLGDYFSKELTLIDKRDKYFGIITGNKHNDIRSVPLVVAVLIATASYQAGLSPPSGYWQDDYIPPANNATNNTNSTTGLGQGQRAHRAGEMIMSPSNLFYFFTLNSLAFHLSVWTILVIIIGLPFSGALYTSTSLLLYAYYASMQATIPTQGSVGLTVGRALYISVTVISTVAAYLTPSVAFSKHQKLQRRVDAMRGSRVVASPEN